MSTTGYFYTLSDGARAVECGPSGDVLTEPYGLPVPFDPCEGAFTVAVSSDELAAILLAGQDNAQRASCLCSGIYGIHAFAADGCNFGPGRFRFHARYES